MRAGQGEEAEGIFDMTGKCMNGLFFMWQQTGADTVLCEIAVIVLVFKPQEGDFGFCGTAGEQEDAEAEQGEDVKAIKYGSRIARDMNITACGNGAVATLAVSREPRVGVAEKP
jgi:hypothetical protein